MLSIEYKKGFLKKISKIKDSAVKAQMKKQVGKVVDDPEVGKPMRYSRKGTREMYIAPYRLAYSYSKKQNVLIFLDIYHKDEQ